MTTDSFKNYGQRIQQAVTKIDYKKINLLADVLWDALQTKKQVFFCGNGGSAANALHMANDFLYGISKESKYAIRVHALTSNQSILTCLANDIAYNEIFSYQLEVLGQKNDVLIALSGSGNSQNMVNAIEKAKFLGMRTFAILGYDGGRCLGIAEESIHIQISDMQVSEDMQLIVGHMVMQWIRDRLLPTSNL